MSIPKIGRREVMGGLALGVAGVLGVGPASAQGAGEGRLTTHAIDTYLGRTRPGLRVDLSILEDGEYRLIETVEAVEGGRTEAALIAEGELREGRYEIMLHLGEYFERHASDLPEPPFLAEVPIRFGVFDAGQPLHVPILFGPWSYSYYRGS